MVSQLLPVETDAEGLWRYVPGRGERQTVDIRRTQSGMLDFYQAVDDLADPFPDDFIRGMTEEQIYRAVIMAESGVPMEEVRRYIRNFRNP